MRRIKPFLKWAGGKSQLLAQYQAFLPEELEYGQITNYCEPFLGGGAVYFWLAQRFSFQQVFLYDINEPLILIYQMVQQEVEALIEQLLQLVHPFLSLTQQERVHYFYQIRQKYNQQPIHTTDFSNKSEAIMRTAELIFLNKTCYNGLFRFNRKGEFNSPCGAYKNPKIFDPNHLRVISSLLKNAVIQQKPFEESLTQMNENSFVYLDPPYRPLSTTANFTAYSRHPFLEAEQLRLAQFCRELNQRQIKFMLSNSDPKNTDPNDHFFEQVYADFQIHRVSATRMINRNSKKRGTIRELLITNYPTLKE